MAKELPEAWQPLFEQRGVSSMSALADAIGVGRTTVIKALTGDPKTSLETLEAIAQGLDVNLIEVALIRSEVQESQGRRPLRLNADDVDLLTPDQRSIIETLVKEFAESERRTAAHAAANEALSSNLRDSVAQRLQLLEDDLHRRQDDAGPSPRKRRPELGRDPRQRVRQAAELASPESKAEGLRQSDHDLAARRRPGRKGADPAGLDDGQE